MASKTHNPPFVRFVRQVSNGQAQPKSSFLSMMADNERKLKSAEWVKTPVLTAMTTTNAVTATDGVWDKDAGDWSTPPTYTRYLDAKYDAFLQAGDGVVSTATMCGYAGIAAYRFKLPSAWTDTTVEKVEIPVSVDKYLRAGVRVSLVFSDAETPSNDWDVIRGESATCWKTESEETEQPGISSFGYLGKTASPYLTASVVDDGTLSVPVADIPSLDGAKPAYMWIYLTPEDFTGRWTMYSKKATRNYGIEGSAVIVGDSVTVTFAAAVEADADEIEYPIVSGGVVPDVQGESSGMVYQSVTAAGSAIAVDENFKVADIAPFKDERSSANSRAGLSVIYANLDVGNLKAVPTSVAFPDRKRHGVGFNVNQSLVDLVDVNGQATAVRTLTMTSSSLLVPFHAPKDAVNAIRFDWADWVQANAPSAETVFNFWIKGGIVNDYPESTLKNPSVYRADKNDVDGWKLLGSAPATSGTATLPLQVTPDTASTVLVTCYIPQEAITHTTSDFDAGSARLVYNGTTPENHLAEDYPDVPMFDPTVGTYPAGSIFKIGCRIAKREGEYGITEYDIDTGIKIGQKMTDSATNANGETVATDGVNLYARKEGVDPAHAWHKVRIMDGETDLVYTSLTMTKIVPIGSRWYIAFGSVSGISLIDCGSGFADSYLGPFSFEPYNSLQPSNPISPYWLAAAGTHHVVGEVDFCFLSTIPTSGSPEPLRVYRSKDYGATWEVLFDSPWTIIGETGGLFAFKVTETSSDDTTVPVTYTTYNGVRLKRFYNFDATGALTYRNFFVLNTDGNTYLTPDLDLNSSGSYAVGRKCDGDILLKVAGNYMVRACRWESETSGGEPGDLHYEYTHDGLDWKVITPPEGESFDVQNNTERFWMIGNGDEVTAVFAGPGSNSTREAYYVTNDFVNFRKVSVPQELYDIGYRYVLLVADETAKKSLLGSSDGTTVLAFVFFQTAVDLEAKCVLAVSFDEAKTLHLITVVRFSRGRAYSYLSLTDEGIRVNETPYFLSRGYTTVKTQKDYPVDDAPANDYSKSIFYKLISGYIPGRTVEILDPREPMRLLGRNSLCIPDITLIG